MTASQSKKYSISRDQCRLVFRTPSFSLDRGSVLHENIYSREFASMLAAAAVAGVASMLMAVQFRRTAYAAAAVFIVVFAAGFPLFRRYVFTGRFLEVILDLSQNIAEVSVKGMKIAEPLRISLSDIDSVFIEKKEDAVSNPDGAAFVEKIAAQHGMAMPGFAEDMVFYVLKLRLRDGTEQVIFSDSSMQDVLNVHEEFAGLINK